METEEEDEQRGTADVCLSDEVESRNQNEREKTGIMSVQEEIIHLSDYLGLKDPSSEISKVYLLNNILSTSPFHEVRSFNLHSGALHDASLTLMWKL